ncbi:MAG: copper chaperone PCu(A)C [Gemmobacter sp.]|jgi:copper(I)-binding protein|nr:copper chaperone PCu(A)C [Gemmobacter sp.]
MFRKSLLVAAATLFTLPAFAEDITVTGAYARSTGRMAKTGGAFMVIENHGAEADRLLAAASDSAAKVELHGHKIDDNGVAQMIEVKEGFAVPAGGHHALARGGDHIMLMGLTRPLAQGDTVHMTLTFERAGIVTIDVPVDLERQDDEAGGMQDTGHNHGSTD